MGPGLPPTSQWAWENITFIVRASEIEWKASLWGDFLPCFKATKDTYYVSLQYTYIVFTAKSCVQNIEYTYKSQYMGHYGGG
jgi:hypothetical protein